MKNRLPILFLMIMSTSAMSQTMTAHLDIPGSSTWPFLWDIEQDTEGNLYVSSEIGQLHKKSNGQWETFNLNLPAFDNDVRGIAIDDNGVIWAGTESGLVSIENGTISLFNSANSDLPFDYVRGVQAYGDKLWLQLPSNGLVLKEGENYTHYLSTNSELPSDDVSDIKVTEDGTLFVSAIDKLTIINGSEWTSYNFSTLFEFGTRVNEMFVDHNQDVWFATKKGVIKYHKATDSFEDLRVTYGPNNYTAINYTPRRELWLGELFEGVHYFDPFGNGYYYDGNTTPAPSQVFDFIYYQDTLRVVGNIGTTVTGLTLEFEDLDGDGFGSNLDCNEMDPAINPGAMEVPYNGVDEDCNPNTYDDDLDQDGFLLAADCDDMNPDVNPDEMEVPYNGLDDDCDATTVDDDLDGDGFLMAADCDDMNPAINPGAMEVPYNGLDDDCDATTLDDDLDEDGFVLAMDCDDTNPAINPDAMEVPYNGLDEDCDATTYDDDLDQDGFVLAEDCDDTNPTINPNAQEIPNNGIDEDCDGDDLIISTHDPLFAQIEIYPNPVTAGIVFIKNTDGLKLEIRIFDYLGRLQLSTSNTIIDISDLIPGTYFMKLLDEESGSKVFKKFLIL